MHSPKYLKFNIMRPHRVNGTSIDITKKIFYLDTQLVLRFRTIRSGPRNSHITDQYTAILAKHLTDISSPFYDMICKSGFSQKRDTIDAIYYSNSILFVCSHLKNYWNNNPEKPFA